MSSTAGISGLGITFLPSPPQPPPHLSTEQHSYPHHPQHYQNPYYQHHPQSLSHSISYDDGILRDAAKRQQRAEAMIRNPSEESSVSGGPGHRRVRIASGGPQVFGGKEQMHAGALQYHALSPLSDFESGSSSDSHSLSPESHGPSSHGSPDYPAYASVNQYIHPALRHAQSMGNLPYAQTQHHHAPVMQATQSRPYPPSSNSTNSSTSPQYRVPISHPIARQPSGTSRLPAFLRDRVAGERMARPKSMVELGALFAAQSIADRSQAPQIVPTRPYDESADSPASEEDLCGNKSPDSVPSSAGGLQRRKLERQLEEQRRSLEKRRHRRHVSLDRLPAHPDLGRQISSSRALSISTSHLPSLDQPRKARPKSEVVVLRSQASMKGLEEAAQGGAFVALDSMHAGFEEGENINPRTTSDGMALGEETVVADEDVDKCESVISLQNEGTGKGLSRSSTLLTAGANPVRRSKELNRLLAPSSKKLGSSSLSSTLGSPTPSATSSAATSSAATASTRQRASSRASSNPVTVTAVPVILEQAKSSSKARVELDLLLESSVVVEGGSLTGRIEVRVRKPKAGESEVWLSKPKVRVVGFEELTSHDARHIFYHHATTVAEIASSRGPPTPLPCFIADSDLEGFSRGVVGQHIIPFNFLLPIGKGAKGGWKGKQGVVRYIVIASIKLKSKQGSDRSIAHFYRHLDIYPYLNPAVVLAPAMRTLVATTAKGLFLGGNGKVNLTAKMHRGTWVAGQRMYVDVSIDNESSKKIKTLTLTLIRTTTIFRPRPWLNTGNGRDPVHPIDVDIDADACQTQTTKKKVAESTIEMGKRGTRGVTAKGSWTGVGGGESSDFAHFMLVPSDALTILRGRHVEVTYAVKVSVGGSLSSDVSVDIPVRIVNFISLDPPPGHSGPVPPTNQRSHSLVKSWSIDQLRPERQGSAPPKAVSSAMSRMTSFDSIQLADLNGSRGPVRVREPTLSRVASVDTLRTVDLPRGESISSEMSRGATLPHTLLNNFPTPPAGPLRNEVLIGRAKERQLSHAMSLECISSAIASATARRNLGHQRSESKLRGEMVSPSSSEDAILIPEADEGVTYYGGGGEHFYDDGDGRYEVYEPSVVSGLEQSPGVQLDDLDDDVDEEAYYRQQRRRVGPKVDLANESEDEVEAVLDQPKRDDGEDDLDSSETAFRPTSRPTVLAHHAEMDTSPRKVRSISPIKGSADMPSPTKSALKKTESFAFATPSSPVKAISPIIASRSPARRQPSSGVLQGATITRRPLPERPSVNDLRSAAPSSLANKTSSPTLSAGGRSPGSQPLLKQASSSSLKRAPALVKRTSTRSLQAPLSPPTSSQVLGSASDLNTMAKLSPALVAVGARSPPTVAAARVAPSSPRKVKSPTLTSARSMTDLRSQPGSPRRGAVLPSVKSKVAALEHRQTALTKLGAVKPTNATLTVGGGAAITRQNSTGSDVSEAASFGLGRANSMVSFKAPMLRKEHKVI